MNSQRTVLVVAAHSDDEVLGCGGTIARHVAEGDTVHAVFMADGVSARTGSAGGELRDRLKAARHAHEILGIGRVEYLDLPDNQMDSISLLEAVKLLEGTLESIAPDIIYTHHHGDLNIDHQITHQAVMTACRPMPNASVKEIFAYEVLSSTEWSTSHRNPFLPNAYVDISEFLEVKLEALRAYYLEMRQRPHSRSIEHAEFLARHRGYSVGFYAAEAFMVSRILR